LHGDPVQHGPQVAYALRQNSSNSLETEMSEPAARAVSTVGIWLAVAIILAFGVFNHSWNGDGAVFVLLIIVVAVCAAAGISTAAVWG